MPLSFQMKETMSGTHHFVDPKWGPPEEQALWFTIEWGQTLPSFFTPSDPAFMVAKSRGEIFIEGLTKSPVACSGSLSLSYLERRELRYELACHVDGDRYLYSGVKKDVELWRPWLLPKTHTTCYGSLEDEQGRILSRSVLHFPSHVRGMMDFLKSLRLTHGE